MSGQAKSWPKVKLGDVLTRSTETVEPTSDCEYREITVRLWGKGVVERGRVLGMDLSGRRFVARGGQFIASRIDARNGAMGLVPATLDGALVTNDFPLFHVRSDRLLAGYLDWLCRTASFVELCLRASEGTTNRVRLKEDAFLALEVPLPPLPEQQRIVVRIDHLSSEVDAAQLMRRQAEHDRESLLPSALRGVFGSLLARFPAKRFRDLKPYITSGPRNWGKNYEASGYRFYRAQDIGANDVLVDDSKAYVVPPDGGQGRSAMPMPGDLLLVITGATVGRVACFDAHREPGFVSQHVAICRLPCRVVLPRFAWWGLRSPMGQDQVIGQRYGQGKPGLNLTNIGDLALPLPPIQEQMEVVAELDALESETQLLQRVQSKTRADLDALLPSILDRAFAGAL